VVNRGLKGVRIERAITRRVPEGAEGRSRCCGRSREAAPGVQPVALGVPVHAVSARAITLPFTQREKLDAVLPSELEGQLPFELDEVVVAASLVSQAEGRSRSWRRPFRKRPCGPGWRRRLARGSIPAW
jgi:hypothetical protein